MTITTRSEQKRGYQEGYQQFVHLRAKWPKAFPAKPYEIRPLASGIKPTVMEAFGWTPAYARAVLMVWRLRPAYCHAVLRYPERINLDGSASGEAVDDEARRMAQERLDKVAANRAQRAEQQQARAAAEAIDAPAPAPTVIPEPEPEPEPAPALPAAAAKPGKLLVAGSAAMAAALKRRLASGAITTEVTAIVAAPAPPGKRDRRAAH
jgi:sRNA-binding protein